MLPPVCQFATVWTNTRYSTYESLQKDVTIANFNKNPWNTNGSNDPTMDKILLKISMLFWHHHFDTSFVTLDSWRTSLKPVVPGGEEAAMDSPVLKPMEEGTEVLDQAVKIGKGGTFFWGGIGDRQLFNSLLQFFLGGASNHVWKVC